MTYRMGLWSAEDDATYRRMFADGCDDRAIGSAVNRSVQAIESRRPHLGLSRPRTVRTVAGYDAGPPWPLANIDERRRGERLLNRALGGKPYRNDSPINAAHVRKPDSAFPSYQSSSGWAV